MCGNRHMKTIESTETLVYFDGVVVFAGKDPIGGHYIGSIIDTLNSVDRYLVAGVSPDRLRQFRSGSVDLRTLFLEAPDGEWFLATSRTDIEQPLVLEPGEGSLLASDFLPEEGFLLDDVPSDDLALQEARERGNVVFEFRVEPLEASGAHRVRMTALGGLLMQIQTVVKHAYRSELRLLSDSVRSEIDPSDGALMDVVVPAAAGSLRVIMEAVKEPDMFGNGELARGLQRLDKVFACADEPDTAKEQLEPHQGHLAGSYIKLMRLLSDNGTGLWYSWAEPTSVGSNRGGVSLANARSLITQLSEVTNLGVEKEVITGEFEKVDRNSGDWGLLTEDGRRFGKIGDDGPSLNGLTVGSRYRFHCVEEVELVDITGRERRTLYLKKIEPL